MSPRDDNDNDMDDVDIEIDKDVAQDGMNGDENGKGTSSDMSEKYPPSFFTDDKGNLKFVNLVVRKPCCCFFGILITALIIFYLLVATVFSAGNPFTLGEAEYDIKDVRSISYDSLRLAQQDITKERNALVAEVSQREEARIQEAQLDVTVWIYESEKPEGVFGTAESISEMRESLVLYTDNKDYKDYCWKEYTNDPITNKIVSKCRPHLTALNMYYSSKWDSDVAAGVLNELKMENNIERYNALALCTERGNNLFCASIPDEFNNDNDKQWARELNQNITTLTKEWDGEGNLNPDSIDQMTEFAAYMMELITKRGLVDFSFDKNFGIDNQVSMYSRAVVSWGGPLNVTSDVVSSSDDDEVTDENKQKDTDQEILKSYIVDNFLEEMEEIASPGNNPEIDSYYFMPALILEVLLKIVSRDGMLAIVSFLFVFFYIRLSVGSWFLALVGFIEIVLSIPISWFIFSVVFKIKYFSFLNVLCLYIVAAIGADDIFIFMDAYKQSAYHEDKRILESLETRMSWVYRRTGNAMAITSATTCSAFLCTLITPLAGVRAFGVFAALVIFIDYVLVMTLFCTAVVIYHNKFETPGCCTSCASGCKNIDPSPTMKALENVADPTEQSEDGEEQPSGDRVTEFFRNKVSGFIAVPKHRLALGLAFTIWIIVAIIAATKLEATKEAEQFLSEDHPLQKSVKILNDGFSRAENDIGLMVYFAWGIEDVDRSGVNLLRDPEFLGKSQFTESFEFNEQCQREILNQCLDLRTDSDYSNYIKQQGGVGTVRCFVEELAAFSALGSLEDCDAVKSGSWRDENWEIAPADLQSKMAMFSLQSSCYSEEKERIMSYYASGMGFNGTSMRYAAIAAESAVLDPFSTKAEGFVMEQYDAMIEISKKLDTNLKQACKGSVMMTDLSQKFVFMNNQRIYVRTALQSSIFGVAIAFTVLLISTGVLHIAYFATLSIVGVLISVVGTTVMLGWSLGTIESILISIVAGFSVDYVVHLAHAYEQAKGLSNHRMRAAFGEMGISVLNGMVTSVGASLPLFLCQLQFFKKFGTFLCLTIAFSWIFANFGFMSVLSQAKFVINNDKRCRL